VGCVGVVEVEFEEGDLAELDATAAAADADAADDEAVADAPAVGGASLRRTARFFDG